MAKRKSRRSGKKQRDDSETVKFVIIGIIVVAAILFGVYNIVMVNVQISHGGGMVPYTRDVIDLAKVKPHAVIEPTGDEVVQLTADIIVKEINGRELRMFGYNGMIPGPLFKVKQGQQIKINFTNNMDVPTTIHSHGLRLDWRFDGTPGMSQDPVNPGESFLYVLDFVDQGIYWYHPHIREDYQQELGLAGNYLVEPEQDDYHNQVNREEVLMIDDIFIDGEDLYPFHEDVINHAIMGRYGNVMLVNGDPRHQMTVKKNEVVRLYITNVANVRPFNLSIPGVKIKMIGSDISNFEKEEFVDYFAIAPAERYVVEVQFAEAGDYRLMNINHHGKKVLSAITVLDDAVGEDEDYTSDFIGLRANNYVVDDIDQFRSQFDKEVDHTLIMTIETDMDMSMMEMEVHDIEWEDHMPEHNAFMTNETLVWVIRDNETGKENMNIHYMWKVGDVVKFRVFNDPTSVHPMQHPLHFHGQRFLVTHVDGVLNDNLVWKDTVLIPTGATVDLLVDASNPGNWMGHCHIAEHLQSGMMFMFHVV